MAADLFLTSCHFYTWTLIKRRMHKWAHASVLKEMYASAETLLSFFPLPSLKKKN